MAGIDSHSLTKIPNAFETKFGKKAFLFLLTVILFYVGAKVGFILTIPGTNIGLVWPPVGIAVTLMLMYGYELWPMVLLGAFITNFPYYLSQLPFGSALIVSAGQSLLDLFEVVFTVFLVKRLAGPGSYFDKLEKMAKFTGLVSLSQAITAVLGVLSHFFTATSNIGLFFQFWFIYWVSNVVSIILIASLVLNWADAIKQRTFVIKPSLQIVYLIISTGITFLAVRYPILGTLHYFEYVTILLVIVAAFLFGVRGAVTVNFTISIVVILLTINGIGPFQADQSVTSMILVEIYLAIITSATLFIVAVQSERNIAQKELRNELQIQVNLVEFAQAILIADSLSEITDLTLKKAREMTGANYGFVGYVEPETGHLNVSVVSGGKENKSDQATRNIVFRHFDGSLAWLLKSKDVILQNNVDEDIRFQFYPDAHMKIEKYLSVPGLAGDQVIGQVALANPGRDFTELDVLSIRRLMSIFSLGLQRLISDIRLRELNTDLEQRVAARTIQLEAANNELEAFSYSVSHDLRAPLRSIDGFSEILQEDFSGQLSTEGMSYLSRIRNSARRMGLLIDDLLEFSRLSRHELRKDSVQMIDLANQALQSLNQERIGRKVDIVFHDLPNCQGDAHLLLQVWENLLSNALKYTRPRNPARIEIGCIIRPAAENIYYVKDNGVGFDMQYAGSLFTVFQRLHAASDFEGTGVGLALVQRIIARHGGAIWFEAGVDQGATFYFTV